MNADLAKALAKDARDLADRMDAAIRAVDSPRTSAWVANTHWIANQLEKGKTP